MNYPVDPARLTPVPLVLTGVIIDAAWIREKAAPSPEFINDFQQTFPSGCDLQVCLRWLVKRHELCDFAMALKIIVAAGPLQTVTYVKGDLVTDRLYLAGSLHVDGAIVAACSVVVGGNVTAERHIHVGGELTALWSIKTMESEIRVDFDLSAGESIMSAGSVVALGSITARWGITADGSVSAGRAITATWIDCTLRIFAGLVDYENPSADDLNIFAEIRRGKVAHGVLLAQHPGEILALPAVASVAPVETADPSLDDTTIAELGAAFSAQLRLMESAGPPRIRAAVRFWKSALTSIHPSASAPAAGPSHPLAAAG